MGPIVYASKSLCHRRFRSFCRVPSLDLTHVALIEADGVDTGDRNVLVRALSIEYGSKSLAMPVTLLC